MESSTTQPLLVSIPHRLGRQEAKRRVDAGVSRLGPDLGAVVGGLDYSWNADTLNFRAAAMWQTITGRIAVLDDAVRVEIDLPWMMRLLGDTITRRVHGRALAMLEKPVSEG
jgi:hypothetical protein